MMNYTYDVEPERPTPSSKANADYLSYREREMRQPGRGNLKGASRLNQLANELEGDGNDFEAERARRISRLFSHNIPDTGVYRSENAVNRIGQRAFGSEGSAGGFYSPSNNEVYVRTRPGSALEHEVGHAVDYNNLMPEEWVPLIQREYEEAKQRFPDAYGSTNLQEFIAEAVAAKFERDFGVRPPGREADDRPGSYLGLPATPGEGLRYPGESRDDAYLRHITGLGRIGESSSAIETLYRMMLGDLLIPRGNSERR